MSELLFEYEEEAIGRAIGIRSEILHEKRNGGESRKGLHWRVWNGCVWWTLEGAEILLREVGVSFPLKKKKGSAVPTLEEALRPAVADRTVGNVHAIRVMLTGVQYGDRRSATGFNVETGEGVRVIVRDNTNLLPGMELQAVKMQMVSDPDLFEMVGPMPRSKGRW